MVASHFRAAVWLIPVMLLWALLALIARIPTRATVTLTNALFVVMLPVTYLAVLGAVTRASRRPRATALRAAALTLGILFTFVLCELAAAVRLVHWELVFAVLRGEHDEFVGDADLGFRHAPNVRRAGVVRSDIEMTWNLPASRADPITQTYDGRGYRNAVAPIRADIILIGDSYVAGHYVSDDETVSRVLETQLGRPVANLGVAGYGTAQELIVLRRDGMLLAPKVVIWFFFEGNDLYNDHEFENALLASPEVRATAWITRHRWWRRSLLRNGHAQLRVLLYPLVPTWFPDFGVVNVGSRRGQKILFWPEAAVPWTEFERERWEKAKQTLRRASTVTWQRDVRLLVVYVPIKFRVYRDFIDMPLGAALRDWALWPLPALFAEFCRAEDLACLDLTPLLRDSVRAGGMPHAHTDSHWSAEGHRLVSQQLVEVLASRGWTPE